MDARIEFNSEGFRQILLSDGCRQLVQSTADDIRDKAGEGFESTVQVGGYGGGRWIGFVSTTDQDSVKAETEEKALTRALS